MLGGSNDGGSDGGGGEGGKRLHGQRNVPEGYYLHSDTRSPHIHFHKTTGHSPQHSQWHPQDPHHQNTPSHRLSGGRQHSSYQGRGIPANNTATRQHSNGSGAMRVSNTSQHRIALYANTGQNGGRGSRILAAPPHHTSNGVRHKRDINNTRGRDGDSGSGWWAANEPPRRSNAWR